MQWHLHIPHTNIKITGKAARSILLYTKQVREEKELT